MLELVGEVGDDEGEDEGTCPWWDAVELSADLRVAVCFDDAGGEEGVAVCYMIFEVSVAHLRGFTGL